MSEQHRDRFDLSKFVLGYMEQQGGIVMPPAFGVYEVLMPDELAAGFHLDSYQRLSFETKTDEALNLTINHPMVETIAEDLMAQPASARVYINHVRLEKRGLLELARRAFTLPNARLQATAQSTEQNARHHHLRFNFKITYVTDEKQEEMASVVMDVQAGHVVRDIEVLDRLESYESASAYESLPLAKPRWRDAGMGLSAEAFQALLTRAEAALREDIAGKLSILVSRLRRFTELDLARVQSYYDDMASDLERRRARLTAEDSDREQSIEDKVAALEAERTVKLEDVHARYQVRVELELINILLIEQPKILTPIIISNRNATITRFAVWDPLVHRLEPLVCDVCSRPGEGLFLCTGGHLAHDDCLAPQCIDCKRVYCQFCAEQITECAVCHQPVCQTSLNRCPTCGRGTCREHRDLCHAADGKPVNLAELAPDPAPEPTPLLAPESPPKSTSQTKRKVSRQDKISSRRRRGSRPVDQNPLVKGVRMHVEVFEYEPRISAFVMRSTKRVLATRVFELTSEGIYVTCQCEKSPCPAHSYFHRPLDSQSIHAQIGSMLNFLRREYWIPPKKVTYYYISGPRSRESQKFILPTVWRDEDMLTQACKGFDRFADQ
jgi:hypothetical protein